MDNCVCLASVMDRARMSMDDIPQINKNNALRGISKMYNPQHENVICYLYIDKKNIKAVQD